MSISMTWTVKSSLSFFLNALIFSQTVISEHSELHVVQKDVVILGGGASGTYAAVRLREDYGRSVFLIEKEPILGGHVNTYNNPATGEAFNYGVQSYIDYQGARAFFERFDIPLQTNVLFASETDYVDTNTGQLVSNVVGPLITNASVVALQKYLDVIVQWDYILLPGYWNFPPGDEIPADLLLPFVDFVAKYGLEDMEPIIFVVSGQSVESTNPTLYVVKNFGTPVVEGFFNNTFFDPVPFNNSLLYGDAERLLGSDVALTSTVVEANRSDSGVQLIVENSQTGARTLVKAKRLLVSVPPSLENLAVFGLDEQETAVFRTWSYGTVYTAVLKTNLVPANTSLAFVTPANSTTAPQPYSFGVTWNGSPDYFWLIFGSQEPLTEAEVEEAILAQMQTVADGGSFPPIGSSTPSSEIVAISNHSSITWGQSVEQLQAGFIEELYSLQGHQNTWYTGGLWCPDYSSNVWAFTDTVLPKLLDDIE